MSSNDSAYGRAKSRQGVGNSDQQSLMAAQPSSTSAPFDSLLLNVRGLEIDVLTGIYSEETLQPQPLRIDVEVEIALPSEPFNPQTALAASKNYMDLRAAVTDCVLMNTHFTLVEAVAEQICSALLDQDSRVLRVSVEIIKLAISTDSEKIGIRLTRSRRPFFETSSD